MIIGIDPGKTTGWAVLGDGPRARLLRCGAATLGSDTTATGVLRTLNAPPGSIVAIESQYVAVNIATTITLAHAAGRWIEAAAELGLVPTLVNPKAWQAAELGLTRAKRSECKAAAMTKVLGLYGPKIANLSEHTADAILIARFVALGSQKCRHGRD